ncbi:MAG: Calx-beta domain-containing protein, partial [Luteimonas sp.]
GTVGRTDRLDFQYSLDAADLATGTWTDVDTLDFSSPFTAGPVGARDGNDGTNRTAIAANIGSLSIANGATVWVRWNDADATGSDDGLAIDEFSLTPHGMGGGGEPVLTISDTSAAEGDAGVSPFFFTVSLSAPAGPGGVSFDYATSDGTATAGSDYAAKNAPALIPEGATSIVLSIDVNGDTDTEANETFAVDVIDILGAIAGDTHAVGTINNDDVVVTPISAIQGSGAMSPLVGQTVTTLGIVTGRKSNGFFVQTADGEDDGNAATSEGVFVFTGAAPPADAAVGNRVQVSGAVSEFVPAADPGQLPLTELGGTIGVTLLSIGNPLPAPLPLSASLPAADGALDQLERFEGMRMTAPSFTVVAPTGGTTNEPNATGTTNGIFSVVVTGVPRPLREPGIQRPDAPPAGGSIPPIPQWDFNPEILTVVSRGIGGPPLDLAVGAQLTNLVGPLDYGFRRYTIVPDPAVVPTIAPGAAPSAARLPTADEFTVAAYNLERFFDTVNDPVTSDPVLTAPALATRLNKASLGIRNFINTPDIVAIVEMENLATLQALATKVNDDAVAAAQPNPEYAAYLQEGNDIGGIDIGFLVKSAEVAPGIDRVEVIAVTQLGKNEMWTQPDNTPALLNDRPPLQLDAVVHYTDGRVFPITVIGVHQRSLSGANVDDANGERVRAKRQKQAEYLANQIQALQTGDPNRRIAVLGDFNAFEFNDGYVDAMHVVTGTPTPDNETAVSGDGVDLVDPDLLNLYVEEPADQRYSFVFDGNAQSLDHVLINQTLGTAVGDFSLDHARI